jgi:hypothetical protein
MKYSMQVSRNACRDLDVRASATALSDIQFSVLKIFMCHRLEWQPQLRAKPEAYL